MHSCKYRLKVHLFSSLTSASLFIFYFVGGKSFQPNLCIFILGAFWEGGGSKNSQ